MSKKQSHTPIANPATDVRKLKQHTAATADELRAFLRELRGKSPKEMLGEVASSDLGRSTVTAATGAAILILAFTIIPFAWSKITGSDEPQKPEIAAPTTPAIPEQPKTQTPPVPSTDALEKLGVGGEKSAPPTVNPLDTANDDLLKDLE